jgi:predicted RNase H-like HicB family nuclease
MSSGLEDFSYIDEIDVKLEVKIWRDDGADVYVGHCPFLDIYSQGYTIDHARQATEEAVRLWVKHTQLRGLSVKR